jgi:hypothetical protein
MKNRDKTRFPRLAAALLSVLLLFGLLPSAAQAADYIDPDALASLTLNYLYDAEGLPGVRTRIYQVATVTPGGSYVRTGVFATDNDLKSVKINGLSTDSAWQAAANTLAGYVADGSVPETGSISADAQGEAAFAGLQTGLYLVVADRATLGDYTYNFTPALLALPSLDTNDAWVYHVTANPKSSRTGGGGGGGQNISYQVYKHWDDLDNEDVRPQSVTIEVLRNGVSYTTQQLSDSNNWTYRWSAADDGSVWQVVERNIAEAYEVTVTGSATAFVVTNSYLTELPEEPGPGGPDPGESPEPGTPPPDGGTTGPTLPQTGQLWWPVPVLSAAGLLLFGLGWASRAKGRRDDEG